MCPADLLEAAQLSWDEAVELGTKNDKVTGVNRPRFLLPERREGWTQAVAGQY